MLRKITGAFLASRFLFLSRLFFAKAIKLSNDVVARIKSNKLPKRETTPTTGRNATDFSWVSVPIYLINIAFQVFARFTVSNRHTRVPLNGDTDTKAILCLKFPLGSRVLKDFSSPKNSFLKSPVVAYHEILQRAFRELVRASTPAKCISVFVQKSRLQLALRSGIFKFPVSLRSKKFSKQYQSSMKLEHRERATPVKVSVAELQLHLRAP